MANLTKPAGYPYALKDPVPHDQLNEICEQYSKAPNFDDGSAHAPTDDIELSGAGGGGFSFDTSDPFPFFGHLDVSSGLRFTAPTSGQVRINSTVALDIFSTNTTFKTGAAITLESGVTLTVLSGATVTIANGSTLNLTGAANVRGTMTFKTTANGGPGVAVWEGTGSQLTGNGGAVGAWAGTWTFSNGLTISSGNFIASGNATFNSLATFNDPMVIGDKMTHVGDNAYRVLRVDSLPDSAATIDLWKADVWIADITDNRLYTLDTPPDDVPFAAIVVRKAGSVGTATLDGCDGGDCQLNGSFQKALIVYDGSAYHAIRGSY